jgi:hypothetical protein
MYTEKREHLKSELLTLWDAARQLLLTKKPE